MISLDIVTWEKDFIKFIVNRARLFLESQRMVRMVLFPQSESPCIIVEMQLNVAAMLYAIIAIPKQSSAITTDLK
jgi:hypothetical protein